MSSENIMKLAVAIPCFNEADSILSVLNAIPVELEEVDEIIKIVIDDGSVDDTAMISRTAGAVVLSHGFNKGLGRAFQTAVDYCTENQISILVTIDGDGQFDPKDIPKLIAPVLRNEVDFVTASRFIDPANFPENIPAVILWGNKKMSSLISGLTRKKFFDVSCGFRAYSREALLNINLYGQFTYTQEVFLDLSFKGLRICEVSTKVSYFKERKSRMANSIMRYALKTLLLIMRCYRDYKPLSFFWGFSLFFGGMAFVLGLIFGAHFLATGKFSGYLWAGFSCGFFSVFSIIFFVLGLIMDMQDRIRNNQDKMLLFMKKHTLVNKKIDPKHK